MKEGIIGLRCGNWDEGVGREKKRKREREGRERDRGACEDKG